jgi:hypothetical protein
VEEREASDEEIERTEGCTYDEKISDAQNVNAEITALEPEERNEDRSTIIYCK